MFLKRERPNTDDFVIKKYLVVREKYLVETILFQEITKILADTPPRFQNIPSKIFFS